MDEKDGHGLKLFKFNSMQQSTILFIKKRAVGSKHLDDYTIISSGEIECWSFLGVKGLTRPPLGHDSEQGSITLNLSKIERFLYELEKWFQ